MKDTLTAKSRDTNTRARKWPLVALLGVAVVAGFGVAFLAHTLTAPAVTQTLTVATASPSSSPTSASLTPTPTASASPTAPQVTVTPTPTPHATQTITNTTHHTVVPVTHPTPAPTHTTIPTPAPTHTATPTCDQYATPQANPALWAACTSGYVAPHIVYDHLVSCKATNAAKTEWKISVQIKLESGSYKSYLWTSDDITSNGVYSRIIPSAQGGIARPAFGIVITAIATIEPMNGMRGQIDTVARTWDVVLDLSSACK